MFQSKVLQHCDCEWGNVHALLSHQCLFWIQVRILLLIYFLFTLHLHLNLPFLLPFSLFSVSCFPIPKLHQGLLPEFMDDYTTQWFRAWGGTDTEVCKLQLQVLLPFNMHNQPSSNHQCGTPWINNNPTLDIQTVGKLDICNSHHRVDPNKLLSVVMFHASCFIMFFGEQIQIWNSYRERPHPLFWPIMKHEF